MKTVLRALTTGKYILLAVVAALTLATASVAVAGSGVGGVFNLGQTNTVNAITKLVGSVTGASLVIDNNSTGTAATALNLQVEPGKSPMKVNSTTKVANLNADRLDGKDSSAFGIETAHNFSFTDECDTPNTFNQCAPVGVTVPAGKTYLMSVWLGLKRVLLPLRSLVRRRCTAAVYWYAHATELPRRRSGCAYVLNPPARRPRNIGTGWRR